MIAVAAPEPHSQVSYSSQPKSEKEKGVVFSQAQQQFIGSAAGTTDKKQYSRYGPADNLLWMPILVLFLQFSFSEMEIKAGPKFNNNTIWWSLINLLCQKCFRTLLEHFWDSQKCWFKRAQNFFRILYGKEFSLWNAAMILYHQSCQNTYIAVCLRNLKILFFTYQISWYPPFFKINWQFIRDFYSFLTMVSLCFSMQHIRIIARSVGIISMYVICVPGNQEKQLGIILK